MAEIRLIDANALRKAFKNHPLCNDVWLQYSRELKRQEDLNKIRGEEK